MAQSTNNPPGTRVNLDAPTRLAAILGPLVHRFSVDMIKMVQSRLWKAGSTMSGFNKVKMLLGKRVQRGTYSQPFRRDLRFQNSQSIMAGSRQMESEVLSGDVVTLCLILEDCSNTRACENGEGGGRNTTRINVYSVFS